MANSELRLFVRCDIFDRRTHGCDYFGSLRYFVVTSLELQLFVRLRYFVKDELTVATILVRCDILWWQTRSFVFVRLRYVVTNGQGVATISLVAI